MYIIIYTDLKSNRSLLNFQHYFEDIFEPYILVKRCHVYFTIINLYSISLYYALCSLLLNTLRVIPIIIVMAKPDQIYWKVSPAHSPICSIIVIHGTGEACKL